MVPQFGRLLQFQTSVDGRTQLGNAAFEQFRLRNMIHKSASVTGIHEVRLLHALTRVVGTFWVLCRQTNDTYGVRGKSYE